MNDDKRERRLRNKHDREDREMENVALEQMLELPEGRRFLWWLLEFCGPHRLAFDPESERRTVFNLGQQNVGNMLLGRIVDNFPKLYVKLLEDMENVRRERSDEFAEFAD